MPVISPSGSQNFGQSKVIPGVFADVRGGHQLTKACTPIQRESLTALSFCARTHVRSARASAVFRWMQVAAEHKISNNLAVPF